MLKFLNDLDNATPDSIARELLVLFLDEPQEYAKIAPFAAKLPVAKAILDQVAVDKAKIAAKAEYERIANEIKDLLYR